MSQEVHALIKRGGQLSVLSSLVTTALLALVAFLSFIIIADLDLQQLWLFQSETLQILLPSLLGAVIVYLLDAHRRMRQRLAETSDALESTREDLQQAFERVAFAYEVTTLVADVGDADTGPVLEQALDYYYADGVALVTGDDLELRARTTDDEAPTSRVAMHLAVQAVRSGKVARHDAYDGSDAIAVPIRVKASLHSVVTLWRREGAFTDREVEDLRLLARVLELATENRQLVLDLREQLNGSLQLLTTLIEDRLCDYAGHSTNVANLAVSVGQRMGVTGDQLQDLKLAGLVHDLGMLRVPTEILELTRPLTEAEQAQVKLHPSWGAKLSRSAGLSPAVQEAIHAHHERVDGTGYPAGLTGSRIPLAARIVAVCDAFDSMTHVRPGKQILSPREAITEIDAHAGKAFDPEVAAAFRSVMTEQLEISALSGLATVRGGMEGVPQPINRVCA